jgi:hypothetical protein
MDGQVVMEGQGRKTIHLCGCSVCLTQADPNVVEYHNGINRVLVELDERSRRLFAGLLAKQLGRGGIQRLAEITGLNRMTIRRGLREIVRAGLRPSSRVRDPGGGRKRAEKKAPAW